MHHRAIFFIVAVLVAAPASAQAQTRSATGPDLSGSWLGRPFMSISTSDPGGAKRGNEDDISYTPAGREKLMANIPPTGPFGQPDKTNDPWMRYCESNGPVRIHVHPARTIFVTLPDKVLMLYEVMQQFRIVRLNSMHPPADDLDPTFWGDSIGWYENGDTLVVDTIGVNGRTWLDQSGHPTSEKLHTTERYKRSGDRLDYEVLINDPGVYSKPITFKRQFQSSNVPFMQVPWNCSVRDNTYYTETLLETAGQK